MYEVASVFQRCFDRPSPNSTEGAGPAPTGPIMPKACRLESSTSGLKGDALVKLVLCNLKRNVDQSHEGYLGLTLPPWRIRPIL